MKKNLTKIIVIFCLIILQLSFFTKFSLFSFGTNLIFVACIALLLKGFLADSFLVATIGGLFLDLVSPYRFGTYSFILIAMLLFLHFIVIKNMPTINISFIFTIAFILFLVVDLILCLITSTLPSWQIFLDGAMNGLWTIAAYMILDKYIKQEEISVNI